MVGRRSRCSLVPPYKNSAIQSEPGLASRDGFSPVVVQASHLWKTKQVRRRFLVEAQQIGLRLKRLKDILHVAEEIGRIEVTADMPPRDIVERLQDLQQRARTLHRVVLYKKHRAEPLNRYRRTGEYIAFTT